MRTRTLVILGILAVLAVVLVFLDRYWTEKREEREIRAKRVFAETIWDQVRKIEVQTEKTRDTVVLQRQRKGNETVWRLLAPFREEADKDFADRFWNTLKDLQADRRLTLEPDADLAQYGFDSPRATIRLLGAGDRELAVLLVGGKTPATNDLYAKLKDRQEVLILPSFRESTLIPALKDFRQKRLTHLKATDIVRVTLFRKGMDPETLRFVKEDGLWKIEQPYPMLASAASLLSLTSTIEFLEAEDFIAEQPDDLSPYALNEPRFRLTVETRDGTQQTFLFGKEHDTGSVYAMVARKPRVVTVRKGVVDDLKRGIDYWRSQQAADFDYYNLERVEIRMGKRQWLLEKETEEGEVWKEHWYVVQGGQRREIELERVDDFLRNLDFAEAAEIRDNLSDAELTELGFSHPWMVIRLKDKDRPEQTMQIVRKDGELWTRNPEFPRTVFHVKKDSVQQIRKSWNKLRLVLQPEKKRRDTAGRAGKKESGK